MPGARPKAPGNVRNLLRPTQRMIGPQITRMGGGYFGSTRGESQIAGPRTGPVRTVPLTVTLNPNESFVLAQADDNRVGLVLVNLDPTNALFYNFGGAASILTGRLNATQTLLLDFTCPTDQVSVFAAAQQTLYFAAMTRSA